MEETYLEKFKELFRKVFQANHHNESPEEAKRRFTEFEEYNATNRRGPNQRKQLDNREKKNK